MYEVASTETEKQAIWRNRKKTATEATPLFPVRWKIDTVMHSPIRAIMQPENPNINNLVRPILSTISALMTLPIGQTVIQPP